MAANSAALMAFWLGKVTGRPLISSWSLRKAITLPVREIEPMMTPRMIESASPPGTSVLWLNSATETRAAVAPPMPLKMATIWGIAVIFTRRAGT